MALNSRIQPQLRKGRQTCKLKGAMLQTGALRLFVGADACGTYSDEAVVCASFGYLDVGCSLDGAELADTGAITQVTTDV